MSSGAGRRLPRSVRPAPDETVESYLARLAAANHIGVDDLGNWSATTPDVTLRGLAAATGRSLTALANALPQLRDQRDCRLSGVTPQVKVQPFCRRCARVRDDGANVLVWARPERKLCLRHRLWIGDAVTVPAEQIDVNAHPAIIHAEIRHRRLTRRFGHQIMQVAYDCARELWVDVTWRGYGQPYRQFRHLPTGSDAPHRWRIHHDDPIYQAAHYPETITLAGLIASRHWRSLALTGSARDRDRFHDELWRRLTFTDATDRPRLHNLHNVLLNTAQDSDWGEPSHPRTEDNGPCTPTPTPRSLPTPGPSGTGRTPPRGARTGSTPASPPASTPSSPPPRIGSG